MSERPGPQSDGANSLSILLVDDDALIRMSTTAMLEDLGHRVQQAAKAQDALAILAVDSTIDVLIADLALPDMNGAELAAKACNLSKRLGVIFATGHRRSMIDLDPAKIRYAFLSKPYDTEQLSQALAKVR